MAPRVAHWRLVTVLEVLRVRAVLPSLTAQAERLIRLGLPASVLAGVTDSDVPDALLVIHPRHASASALAPLLTHRDQPGFVVVDLADVDRFEAIAEAAVPDADVYMLTCVDRGDEYANRSPDDALPAILSADRTPLTLTEGIHWLLQQPAALERNHCFMTIGSRLTKPGGKLDARTPAIWISNGTGRDGRERRHAPKVGWCWAANRHTWLGFASATARHALRAAGTIAETVTGSVAGTRAGGGHA